MAFEDDIMILCCCDDIGHVKFMKALIAEGQYEIVCMSAQPVSGLPELDLDLVSPYLTVVSAEACFKLRVHLTAAKAMVTWLLRACIVKGTPASPDHIAAF